MAFLRKKKAPAENVPTEVCPYCGVEIRAELPQCPRCTGKLDEFNRRLIQQHLGPWYVRLPRMVFRPGCSYTVVKDLVRRGVIEADTIVRGPTTRQYWMYAKDTPGVAHLLGLCHACGQWVESTARACPHCSREFPSPEHRNYLGLDPDNHRLLIEAARRERGDQPQPRGDGSAHQQSSSGATATSTTRPASSNGGGGADEQATADRGTSGAAGSETLFELAEAATERGRKPPKMTTVPRRKARGSDRTFWIMLAVTILLALAVIAMVVVLLLTRGGDDPAAAEPPTQPAAEQIAPPGSDEPS